MTLPTLNGFTKKVSDLLDRPNTQMTSAELKAWFDSAPEELRVFVNNLIAQLNADFALKSEISSALLGQILDGSLTDIKLSNTAGQIKERLSSFIATKGQPNGITPLDTNGIVPDGNIKKGQANGVASLGANLKLVPSQLGLSIKTGTISHGATIPQTAGYTNYYYFVSINYISESYSSYTTRLWCSVDVVTRVVTMQASDEGAPGTSGTANYLEIAW